VPRVQEWIEATNPRFDRITELRADGDKLLARLDIPGYRASLRTFAGEVGHLRSSQASEPVPAIAADANHIALKALDLFLEAAQGLAAYHAPGGADAELYSRSIGALQDAESALVDLDEAIATIRDTCP
jgi:hypothetical protein